MYPTVGSSGSGQQTTSFFAPRQAPPTSHLPQSGGGPTVPFNHPNGGSGGYSNPQRPQQQQNQSLYPQTTQSATVTPWWSAEDLPPPSMRADMGRGLPQRAVLGPRPPGGGQPTAVQQVQPTTVIG